MGSLGKKGKVAQKGLWENSQPATEKNLSSESITSLGITAIARRGRPRKFARPETLANHLEVYFLSTPEPEWTISGLCLAIGIGYRTLWDYEHSSWHDLGLAGTRHAPAFKAIVQRAKAMIMRSYEKDLRKKARPGDIFALKQFGWSDEQGKPGNTLQVGKLTVNLNRRVGPGVRVKAIEGVA